MRIAIIGAGAMGSLFGGYLTQSGQDVFLLDTWTEHIGRMCQTGLLIEEPDRTRLVHPRAAVTAVAEIPAELAIILVKTPDTPAALAASRPLLGPDTLVLTLQNGLGNAEDLAAGLPANRIVLGTTAHGCSILGPGHIRHAGRGPTFIGAYGSVPPARLAAIAAVLESAGFQTEICPDIQRQIWLKLLVNVGINPLTALLRVTNGQLAGNASACRLMRSLIAEAVAVAGSAGQIFDADEQYRQCLAVAAQTAANQSSMLQDVLRQRRTEIRRLNGIVAEMAEKAGLPAPCNQAVAQLIFALEETF